MTVGIEKVEILPMELDDNISIGELGKTDNGIVTVTTHLYHGVSRDFSQVRKKHLDEPDLG